MSIDEQQREFAFTAADFAFLQATVKQRAGISLGPHKRNLVYSRLARRLRTLRLGSFADYCALLKTPEGDKEAGLLVNAITTNMTSFFREPHHFEHLQRTLEGRFAAPGGSRRLRLWSAGCSSGEEAYSMAMTLREAARERLAGWDAKILATDIDTNMVATAAAGAYDSARAATIPAACRARYTGPNGKRGFAIDAATRSLISFLPLNLLEEWPMRGPFDAIFCRNVVIYFDKPTQKRLFDRFADMLAPGGWLYIGHSETLFRISDRFVPAGRTVYRKAS
jgi:chemotaxis protein methyltransferase CheR